MVRLRKRQIVNLFNGVKVLFEIRPYRLVVKLLIILSSLTFYGCEDLLYRQDKESMYIQMDTRLPQDSNGYFRLNIDRNNWQTLHRLSGVVTDKNGDGIDVVGFNWESNLFWSLGDSLGYIVRRNFNDEGRYVSVDTSYIIGFEGQIVPTINPFCYSNSKGEFNQMTGFVRSMIGDTAIIKVSYSDLVSTLRIVLD